MLFCRGAEFDVNNIYIYILRVLNEIINANSLIGPLLVRKGTVFICTCTFEKV